MAKIERNGATIAYSDVGTGEPVLLIHCSSTSGDEWRPFSLRYGRRLRVITPDQWGCGESDPWAGHGSLSLAGEAAPILEIIDRIGGPVHLVGHSYGGGVALEIARENPQMILSLSLVEPSAFYLLRRGNIANKRLFREIADIAEITREALITGDYWGGMAGFIDYWSGEGTWDALSREARVNLSQRLSKVVLDFHALFDETATLQDYKTLEHQTLILCGEISPSPSRRIVEMLAAAIPRSRVELIPGAGHMSPLTHADRVRSAIFRHVGEIAAEGSKQTLVA